MTRSELESAIVEALQRASPRPIAPKPTTDLVAELGLTSIDILEAVADLEDRYAVTVPASDLARFRTIADAATYLEHVLAARDGA